MNYEWTFYKSIEALEGSRLHQDSFNYVQWKARFTSKVPFKINIKVPRGVDVIACGQL
jgi:hypothetical protein